MSITATPKRSARPRRIWRRYKSTLATKIPPVTDSPPPKTANAWVAGEGDSSPSPTVLGSTDGIPFADSKGRWEYDGKELILELTRTFEDVKSTFSTTRVFIGDVIALNDVPPQVQGAIKMTPSPTSDDMLRIPRHTLPTDAVGYFVAVKIPEVPGAL